ncbi:hypothetical protein [Butyrivibrio sp. M55]|uniref:hypothetical protein n=1 Tax=Butyrivibrio sp. M55 TaxID=1855323 RepID=UPI0008EC7BA7|nr:hypothetical protein [Butyrivibrio sp. M55]SFU74655.1 hypothetical protein SAMN05216540_10827 [Butyrivibrio sp. M55]
MGKSWDTKKVNEFIEYFEHAACRYMESLGDVYASYERYRNNETFVGGGAEQSKAFIGIKQEEYNRLQYELSREMVKRYVDIDETFKTMVDPDTDARIDTDVVRMIKSHFMEQLEEFESEAFAIQQKSMEAEGKFKKYCGDIEEIYVRDAVRHYDEFCNTGGFLQNCIDKMEEFDTEASNRLNRSGLKNAINEHIAEMSVKASELDSIQFHTQSVSKQIVGLVAFGATLGVKGIQDAASERKALDIKVDKWLLPNYKLSPEEVKEAQQLAKIKLSSLKFDPILGCPILRTKEEKELYKRYSALANKVSKLGCFMMGVRKPIYNLLNFTLDCSDFIMSHTTGLIIEKGSDLIDHCFGTDTNKYIHLFVNSYKDFRGDVDKEMEMAIENSKLQNSREFGYGEATGVLLLYYITSEISSTLEMGKEVGFAAKQAKENIQDLVIDTRELYQELSRDGELSKSDWALLGENVAGNFSMNLFFGGFSEVTDIFKVEKDLHLKKVEKVAEEAENVKKVEKAVDGASDVTKVTGDTAEDVAKAGKNSYKKLSEKSTANYLNDIEYKNGKYFTNKEVIDEIGRIEARGEDFSNLNKKAMNMRPSTEGGISVVYRYSDNNGTKYMIHEVTDGKGNIIHRDFDALKIPSGQIINKGH